MSLGRHESLGLLARIQKDLDELFHHAHRSSATLGRADPLLKADWAPRIDIDEDDSRFVVTADIPGVAPADIRVSMDGGLLSISGERKAERTESTRHHRRRECERGYFERRFQLPATADGTKVSAEGRHGVLTVIVPKKPAGMARTVRIGSAD